MKKHYEEFLDYVSLYCSINTVKDYQTKLDVMLELLPEKVTPTFYVDALKILNKKNISNTSIQSYFRAIKVYINWLYNDGYILELPKKVKLPKKDDKVKLPLSNDRVISIMNGINNSYMAERNICIFKLMIDCGLRVGEVCELKVNDIDFIHMYIIIKNSKGNKNRIVPLPREVSNFIISYLSTRIVQDKNNSEYVFLNNNGDCKISENAIKLLFQKLKKYDPLHEVHCHLLRHTFATSFILGGGNIEVLRVMLGHETYEITKQYIHIASQMRIIDFDIYKLDNIYFKSYNYNVI